jgi:5-methylcytosine-specific restriction endonuclease McrA
MLRLNLINKKYCSKCRKIKYTSMFHFKKRNRDGLCEWCKSCKSTYCKKYYAINSNRIKSQIRAKYLADPDRVKSRNLRWYYDNYEDAKLSKRMYRNVHRQEAIDRSKKWRGINCRYKRACDRAYYVNNKQAYYMRNKNRDALYRSAVARSGWNITLDWWSDLVKLYDNKCAYCGVDGSSDRYGHLTIEHVIPLSRGGEHADHNIVPACSGCQGSKGAKLCEEWGRFPRQLMPTLLFVIFKG